MPAVGTRAWAGQTLGRVGWRDRWALRLQGAPVQAAAAGWRLRRLMGLPPQFSDRPVRSDASSAKSNCQHNCVTRTLRVYSMPGLLAASTFLRWN